MRLLNYGAAVTVVFTQYSSYLTFNNGFLRQEKVLKVIHSNHFLCNRAISKTASLLLQITDMSVKRESRYQQLHNGKILKNDEHRILDFQSLFGRWAWHCSSIESPCAWCNLFGPDRDRFVLNRIEEWGGFA